VETADIAEAEARTDGEDFEGGPFHRETCPGILRRGGSRAGGDEGHPRGMQKRTEAIAQRMDLDNGGFIGNGSGAELRTSEIHEHGTGASPSCRFPPDCTDQVLPDRRAVACAIDPRRIHA
jgi:hypothetical protein